jgi:hypothetical protein
MAVSTRTFEDYRGTVLNLVLMGYYVLFNRVLLEQARTPQHNDVQLPVWLLAVGVVFLLAEGRASRYVIAVEHTRFLQHNPGATWPGLLEGRSYTRGILALFAVIWRSFFRIYLITAPLIHWLELQYSLSPQVWQVVYWLVGGGVAWRELVLVARLQEPPPPVQPVWYLELWARWVVLTLLAICLSFFEVGFGSLFPLRSGEVDWHAVRQGAPLLLLLFGMFFVPVRLLEFYTTWVDCRTWGQKAAYLLSTAALMLQIIVF